MKVSSLPLRTVSDREDTKLLKAIHNDGTLYHLLFQTVSDREDTKLLKAIHNPTCSFKI